jgi:hypothetical protein
MKKIKRIIVLLMGVVLPSLLLAQNTNISNGFVFDGEPYLAINPNNPQHMVVAWMGFKMSNQIVIKTKVSFNGGQKPLAITAVWRNGGCSASYDSFVVGSSAVLRLNFCAKNPPLRQAAKR